MAKKKPGYKRVKVDMASPLAGHSSPPQEKPLHSELMPQLSCSVSPPFLGFAFPVFNAHALVGSDRCHCYVN